jgi:hypothetical protein
LISKKKRARFVIALSDVKARENLYDPIASTPEEFAIRIKHPGSQYRGRAGPMGLFPINDLTCADGVMTLARVAYVGGGSSLRITWSNPFSAGRPGRDG